MKKEKLINFPLSLSENQGNHLISFRQNIDYMMELHDMTLKELAEKADIPYGTLNTFLYDKEAKDCKLSTAIKISKVFGISVDELVGAGTIEPKSKESLAMARSMPDHVMYLIRSFIRHQYKMFSNLDPSSVHIPVLLPECVNTRLRTTNVTKVMRIDHLSDSIKSKVVMGLQIPCEHYEPHYMPNDILLLAADRDGLNNEKCVIVYKGNYFIAIKKISIVSGEKKVKYVSVLDGKNEVSRGEIEDKLGYVVGYLNSDGSWGVR